MTPPRAAFAVTGLVAALVLAEGIARLHGDWLCTDEPGIVYQRDAQVGWRHVPELAGQVGRCTSPGGRFVRFETDSRGLVGPERPYAKPADTARILLLGGNVAEGIGVRPEATFFRIVEELADRRRGAGLEVINAGTAGWVLDNDLLYLREEGLRFAPDAVVVVLDPVADLTAISPRLIAAAGQRVPVKPFFRLVDEQLVLAPPLAAPPLLPPEPAQGVLGHSQIYRLLTRTPARRGPPFAWVDAPAATPGELERARPEADALARALLLALRDESEAAGARLLAMVAPVPNIATSPPARDAQKRAVELATGLGIPTVDLRMPFAVARNQALSVYQPGTARWSGRGHFIAALQLWRTLEREAALPGVVMARTRPVWAAKAPRRLSDVPAALVGALWDVRHTLIGRFVAYGLLTVALLWCSVLLPPAARDWLLVGLGVAVVGVFGDNLRLAGAALAFAVVFYAAVERLPVAASLTAVGALLLGLILAATAWRPESEPGDDLGRAVYLALASNVALLRLAAYAADRWAGVAGVSLRAFLGGLFFFPLVPGGPIEPLNAAHRAPPGTVTPDGVGAAAVALLRLGWGLTKVIAALLLLNGIMTDVFVTRGSAVSHPRLWLWIAELSLFLYAVLSGWSDMAVGLARLAGRPVGENFDAPWRATSVRDFWRRFHVSLGDWLRRYVYVPLGGRAHAARNLVLVMAVSALWHAWALMKVGGYRQFPLLAASGLGLWALLHAGALVFEQRSVPPASMPRRVAGWAATMLFVSLAWVPAVLPAWNGLGDVLGIYARLLFLR
jgi:hypothetical protein